PPIYDESAKPARLGEVNHNPRPRIIRTRPPTSAAKRLACIEARLSARSAGRRSRAGTAAIIDPKIAKPHGPGPSFARDDRDLNGAELRHDAAAHRTPRELHLTAVNLHILPARGGVQILFHMPPHVLTRGVD